MKTFISFSLLVVLCLLVVGTVWAADEPLTLKIYATDQYKSDSILIGLNAAATYGIDLALGEYELPPSPPTFDIRSGSYSGFSSVGKGVRTDYHDLIRPTQRDIWKLEFTSSQEGEEVTFSWASAGLGLRGGYWMLTEEDGTPLCDMTTHTSYTYPSYSIRAQFILLWRGDGAAFLTARSESLAYAQDIKGKNAKGKPIKKAADGSEGEFTLTWAGGAGIDSVNDLHVIFTKAVQILSVTPACIATATLGKKDVEWDLDFSPDWLYTIPSPNNVVKIVARTHKGKGKVAELYVKKYWWTKDHLMYPTAKSTIAVKVYSNPGTERAVLPKPNWYNLVDQVYQVKYPKDLKLKGICVGTTNPIAPETYKFISHPKTADISKSLWKGSKAPAAQTHVTGGVAPACLAVKKDGTPLPAKEYKTWAPITGTPGQYNPLFAELLALKISIDINDGGWTGASSAGMLKNLMIKPIVNDCTWMPISVDSLVHVADWFMSCAARPTDPITTAPWLYSTITRINAAFAGAVESLSWWNTIPIPTGGVIAKPKRMLAEQDVLYRESWSVPDPVNYGFVFKESEPLNFRLNQNYPNPFNPTTTIEFELPEDAMVTLKIYNLLGQEVETLINQEELYEGTNEVPFDASRYASGVYYYRLIVNEGQFQQVKKMMLLK
jgi:hypothetical protein